ncbi:unnamed protein product [Clonostachys byssicola]|uniref:Uncharacterized protein n=1 Tax=Clonostachys byssicola TaxID=160290 RepID=A0A9N9V0R0_9HYPO|nr:unnamed protein product [Clonostachys byssicola]
MKNRSPYEVCSPTPRTDIVSGVIILSVPHINNLIECTGVLPSRTEKYTSPDQKEVNKWIECDRAPMREEAILLMNGGSLKQMK